MLGALVVGQDLKGETGTVQTYGSALENGVITRHDSSLVTEWSSEWEGDDRSHDGFGEIVGEESLVPEALFLLDSRVLGLIARGLSAPGRGSGSYTVASPECNAAEKKTFGSRLHAEDLTDLMGVYTQQLEPVDPRGHLQEHLPVGPCARHAGRQHSTTG